MSNLPTRKQLWESMTKQEIEVGCGFLLQGKTAGSEATVRNILNALAKSMRFRPDYIRRRDPAKNTADLVKRVGTQDFLEFRDDVIRASIVAQRTPMLVAFLDAVGVPHKNGFVEGEPDPPNASQFAKGIREILTQFNPREVAQYLGYLALYGGSFWSALPSAIHELNINLPALLAPEPAQSPPPEVTQNAPPEATAAAAEDSDEFTNLDNWLIQTAVATAFGEMGALSPDRLEDLVEEVVSLNATRHHTLFHRGYFHALFNKPFQFNFPGENEERRLWYMTGVIFGLLRANRRKEVLGLFHDHPELADRLRANIRVRCGSMLLPHLYPLLWEAKEFSTLLHWLEKQLEYTATERCMNLLLDLQSDTSNMVRRGEWVEADGFLRFMEGFIPRRPDLSDELKAYMIPINARRRAQVLQLKGDFRGAEALLKPLSETEELEDSGNALCDLALMKAGFRSLTGILPTKDEPAASATADALQKCRELLESAIQRHPDSATNAYLCLGLQSVVRRKAQEGTHFLTAALAGMLKKEDAYSEGGLIQWTRFLLGLAMLENADPREFQYARNYIDQSLSCDCNFPSWLWIRALHAASLFDDTSLAASIADYLLNGKGSAAWDAIWQSGLAASAPTLRQKYLEWLEIAKVSLHDKWDRLTTLLPVSLKDQDTEQAESILDALEGIAAQGGPYRGMLAKLLEDDRNYSPAWSLDDALETRIKLLEIDGDMVAAIALLRNRFFTLRNSTDTATAMLAGATLSWMESLNADKADVDELRKLLPADAVPTPEDTCRLKAGAKVTVLYIGGNETQMAYERDIRSELLNRYPGLTLEFYFPGWTSRWNVHLERVKSLMNKSHVVVLNTLVRTQFGRHVRSACTPERPWFPCTGRGRKSLSSSIELAAVWVANKRSHL